MGKKVDVEDLITAPMIAERLGVVDARVVHTWARRHNDFPRPVLESERIHVWLWSDVERWLRSSGRTHLLPD